MSSSPVVDAMSSPAFHGTADVRVEETHLSYVFLAGDRAYKLKKPVVLPFVDYGTRERRRLACEAEVRLNRRLAPSVYLGVRSVREGPRGLELAEAGAAGALDHVVEMRRFAEGDTLAAKLAAGTASDADLASVGRFVARFHGLAEHADPEEAAQAFAEALHATFDDLTAGGDAGQAAIAERLRGFAASFLDHKQGLLRARAPFVVDGHGDLRAEHVLLERELAIVDCVEFDDALRRRDAASDIAFLLMDLEHQGCAGAAETVLAAYEAAGGDSGPEALLALYKLERAAVRAKVALVRAAQLPPDGARAARDEAGRLLGRARRYAWRARMPFVVVICGLAGSGKTHLASALAAITGIEPVSTDVTRKQLAGIAPRERARPEHYTREFSERTYEEVGRRARGGLALEGAALVDGTFRDARDRAAFARGLGADGPAPLFVRCAAPREVLRERLRTRAPGVSDATVEVLEGQAFEELEEVPPERRIELRTDRAVDEVVADLEDRVDRGLRPAGRAAAP